MYESVDANFDDMGMHVECRARDLLRKEHKIVMKSDIVYDTAYKKHIKDVRIFYHENNLD